MLIALILTARFYSKLFNPRRNEHSDPPQKYADGWSCGCMLATAGRYHTKNVTGKGRCFCMGGTARMGTQCDAVKTAVGEG